MLEAALAYASGEFAGAAWPVFPTGADKQPHRMLPPRPKREGGFKLATCDREQLTTWWTEDPDAGIGVDLGRAGLAAVDFEGRNKGYDPAQTRRRVVAARVVPTTLEAATPGPGAHLLYAVPPSAYVLTSICDSDGVLIDGVEIRRRGQYVILPPGPGRSWVRKCTVSPAPAWMLREPPLRRPPPTPSARQFAAAAIGTFHGRCALGHALDRMARVPVGKRHNTILFWGVRLHELVVEGQLDERYAMSELTRAAIDRGKSEAEITAALDWARDRARGA